MPKEINDSEFAVEVEGSKGVALVDFCFFFIYHNIYILQ